MSSTDHPVPGPDEPGGVPDRDASVSRARVAAHGWLPWAAGAALVLTQVLIFVAVPGHWRAAGAVLLVAVTLLGIAVAVFGGDEGDGRD